MDIFIDLNLIGPLPRTNVPSWMQAKHEVWFRDTKEVAESILGNPDFADAMDYAPYMDLDNDDCRRYSNFMSGLWSWEQAVSIWGYICVYHKLIFR